MLSLVKNWRVTISQEWEWRYMPLKWFLLVVLESMREFIRKCRLSWKWIFRHGFVIGVIYFCASFGSLRRTNCFRFLKPTGHVEFQKGEQLQCNLGLEPVQHFKDHKEKHEKSISKMNWYNWAPFGWTIEYALKWKVYVTRKSKPTC